MKKFIALILGAVVSVSLFSNSAFASEVDNEVTKENNTFLPGSYDSVDVDNTETIQMYNFLFYLNYNKGYQGMHNGSWKNATSATGQGSLTYSKTFTVSNSYTGTLSASKKDISATVGFSLTKSHTTTASFSVNVPKGKKYTIQWRPVYKKYKVEQHAYSGPTKLSVKNVYPLKFDHIEFRLKP